MIYRETGQYKTSYAADQAIFPIAQDRWVILAVGAVAFILVPVMIDDYWANAIFLPLLCYTMAALGLNILVGYCGQISLGTGGFMAVGAYASYKLMTTFPGLDFALIVIAAGVITAAVPQQPAS